MLLEARGTGEILISPLAEIIYVIEIVGKFLRSASKFQT
jgi:hypothetical protein